MLLKRRELDLLQVVLEFSKFVNLYLLLFTLFLVLGIALLSFSALWINGGNLVEGIYSLLEAIVNDC